MNIQSFQLSGFLNQAQAIKDGAIFLHQFHEKLDKVRDGLIDDAERLGFDRSQPLLFDGQNDLTGSQTLARLKSLRKMVEAEVAIHEGLVKTHQFQNLSDEDRRSATDLGDIEALKAFTQGFLGTETVTAVKANLRGRSDATAAGEQKSILAAQYEPALVSTIQKLEAQLEEERSSRLSEKESSQTMLHRRDLALEESRDSNTALRRETEKLKIDKEGLAQETQRLQRELREAQEELAGAIANQNDDVADPHNGEEEEEEDDVSRDLRDVDVEKLLETMEQLNQSKADLESQLGIVKDDLAIKSSASEREAGLLRMVQEHCERLKADAESHGRILSEKNEAIEALQEEVRLESGDARHYYNKSLALLAGEGMWKVSYDGLVKKCVQLERNEKDLSEKLAALQAAKEQLSREHAEALQTTREQHDSNLLVVKQEHASAAGELEKRNAASVNATLERHCREKQKIKDDCGRDIKSLTDRYAELIDKVKKSHDVATGERDQKIAGAERSLAQTKASLESKLARAVKAFEIRGEDIDKLQKEKDEAETKLAKENKDSLVALEAKHASAVRSESMRHQNEIDALEKSHRDARGQSDKDKSQELKRLRHQLASRNNKLERASSRLEGVEQNLERARQDCREWARFVLGDSPAPPALIEAIGAGVKGATREHRPWLVRGTWAVDKAEVDFASNGIGDVMSKLVPMLGSGALGSNEFIGLMRRLTECVAAAPSANVAVMQWLLGTCNEAVNGLPQKDIVPAKAAIWSLAGILSERWPDVRLGSYQVMGSLNR